MRRFTLARLEEKRFVTVAEGIQFSDETVVIRWVTSYQSTAIYSDVEQLRGHNSDELVWLDDDPTWAAPDSEKIVPFRLRPATLT